MKTGLQALVSTVVGFVMFGVLLFLPAGTFHYWQAWVFLAVFAAVSVAPTVYWAWKRPDVVRRRMNAGPTKETRPAQKLASTGIFLTFAAALAFSAFDHRLGWSDVPLAAVVLGNVLATIGLGISILVVQQNSYAAANITVESEQSVTSTGLYGVVRHPMYLGAMITIAGIPLALGSYWGLVLLVPALLVFAFRIIDEEKMLRQELNGYSEYAENVHSRLVPLVW